MLILICNKFPILDINGIPTGREELLVDYAIDDYLLKPVVVPCDHPNALGATFSPEIGEWVIKD